MTNKTLFVFILLTGFIAVIIYLIMANRKTETQLLQPSTLQLSNSNGTLDDLINSVSGLISVSRSNNTTNNNTTSASGSGAMPADF